MKLKKNLLVLAAGAVLSASAQTAPQLNANNIDEVLKAMTLEEKAILLVGATNQSETGGAMGGYTKNLVPGAAGVTAPIQRLGVPMLVLGMKTRPPTRCGAPEPCSATYLRNTTIECYSRKTKRLCTTR